MTGCIRNAPFYEKIGESATISENFQGMNKTWLLMMTACVYDMKTSSFGLTSYIYFIFDLFQTYIGPNINLKLLAYSKKMKFN